ncbi:MAG: hypothetical protein HYZ38_25020 [Mycobacterium sp.]|nr:hypothetical protein [Mycobacterium sp.]
MADLTVTALDPLTSNRIRYNIGAKNWAPTAEDGHGWVPDLAGTGSGTVRLPEAARIDVLLLGDGFESEADFHWKLDEWIATFFKVEVYERFRGAFRIRALFNHSDEPASKERRRSYYKVAINEAGDILRDPWWQEDDEYGVQFRDLLWDSIRAFGDANTARYPDDLSDSGVIHNPLAGLFSHLVVMMLVRRVKPDPPNRPSMSPIGMTRRVDLTTMISAGVNVGFGENSLHEFGHAFAYLEDEYIQKRGRESTIHRNPSPPSVFDLSNLSFEKQIDRVPWLHLSPWGDIPRQAAGVEASPIVGWLWRGGEHDGGVWHSEYQCLMNGRHQNYAYTPVAASDPTAHPPTSCDRFRDGGADLRWRNPPTYCLWCQEIVVIRTLEKTGQLDTTLDDPSTDIRGRDLYRKWVAHGRAHYWESFAVADRIRERESWYANPSLRPGDELCQLRRADGTYLRLDASPLYEVFDAKPVAATPPGPRDDDAEHLLVVTA